MLTIYIHIPTCLVRGHFLMLHYVSGTLSLMKSGHPTPSYSSNHLVKPFLFKQSYTFYLFCFCVCVCVCAHMHASYLSHSVRVSWFFFSFLTLQSLFSTYFVSLLIGLVLRRRNGTEKNTLLLHICAQSVLNTNCTIHI